MIFNVNDVIWKQPPQDFMTLFSETLFSKWANTINIHKPQHFRLDFILNLFPHARYIHSPSVQVLYFLITLNMYLYNTELPLLRGSIDWDVVFASVTSSFSEKTKFAHRKSVVTMDTYPQGS